MKFSQKIQLLSLLPLLVAMLAVAWLTEFQFQKLSDETAGLYKTGFIKSREQELKNYTSLAVTAIEHAYEDGALSDVEAQQKVRGILTDLSFGNDGYFFAYNENGDGVVHPKQPYRIDSNWWDLQDPSGQYIIRQLIYNAQAGGDFLEYVWEKPSSNQAEKKLAYSVMLERWQWMLGTGIYIDDIDREVSFLQGKIDEQIQDSSFVILLIALSASALVFVSGTLLHTSERKLADEKLQELTKRVLTTQDEERQRLSRELHDGISQLLASAKFSLETATIKIQQQGDFSDDIEKTSDILKQTLKDLRRLSRDLHPSILDDHGLSVGIEALAKNFAERTSIEVTFDQISVRNLLPFDVKTTLYRVAQEALTNVERHAEAGTVSISIKVDKQWIVLSINDNGKGFDVESMRRSKSPKEGIGLRNMHERLAYHGGVLVVESSGEGTYLKAKIPKSVMRYSHEQETINDVATTKET